MKAYFISLAFLLILIVSCNSNNSNEKPLNGDELFTKRCVVCHGPKGDAGISGAKDLSASTIDENMARVIILHGKGTMPPFKSVLSTEETELIIKHIQTLKK